MNKTQEVIKHKRMTGYPTNIEARIKVCHSYEKRVLLFYVNSLDYCLIDKSIDCSLKSIDSFTSSCMRDMIIFLGF